MSVTYAIGIGMGEPSREDIEDEIRTVMGDLIESRMGDESSALDKGELAILSERLDAVIPAMPTEQLSEALGRAASMSIAALFQHHRSEFSLLMRETLPMAIMSAAPLWASE